jgi:hypothetical protein
MEAERGPRYEEPGGPREGPHRRPRDGDNRLPPDPAALFAMLDGMRRMAPRELEDQVTNLIREFLLTLRSLIDWYLERLDRKPAEPTVEDIPID